MRSADFPESSENRLGLLLMNLEIHGCTGMAEANWLCDLGMAAPSSVVRLGAHSKPLVFEAIELELSAILETGKILAARAVRHPFIAYTFARMEENQFADDGQVVFSVFSYLISTPRRGLFTPMVRTAVHRPAPASGRQGGKGPAAELAADR
ncbi:hypothetical protein M3484_06620 [Pseudomonas sp. GX19020]|uniref:hypothetical protein n=1 Tax=Pseudomonas sp. GX19020 TaxID=2942277 RepID=UPI002019B9F9|nr:hypothetical protein [Pseudomonas sp. GX19020]MCL4066237.1 hypothetical protein [Pseudomonas sp. GX19020]